MRRIALRARGCYEAASSALATLLHDDFVHASERELPGVVARFRHDFEARLPRTSTMARHTTTHLTPDYPARFGLDPELSVYKLLRPNASQVEWPGRAQGN